MHAKLTDDMFWSDTMQKLKAVAHFTVRPSVLDTAKLQ